MKMLHETLSAAKALHGDDFFIDLAPDYIAKNLNPKFDLRKYQKEAFGRFEFYLDKYPKRPKNQPINVLYHMATGSGKTLVMAGEILSLYKRGYRDFLFFVNSTNIIKKTKENFLNKASSKYLFNDSINIDGKEVRVREVDNFASTNPDDINIVFTTIQGLHTVMNFPKENSLSMEDFEERKVVLISDEAHHLNAETKNKPTNEELFSLSSWEGTVKSIFNAHPENIMLEYTATAELSVHEIKEKYQDVVIFDYPLKHFRVDGYSKEVKVLEVDSEPLERALQAVILSQYRRKIFQKHKLIIKPVVMFKSRVIADSKAFHKKFNEAIAKLTEDELVAIKDRATPNGIVAKAFKFFADEGIKLDALALELQGEFSPEKTLEVNSKESLEKQQILLNTLEDQDNEIRVVLAVDKLNEGWDVLNLFDIVRLYNTRDARGGAAGKTTMQEAQLIGRGARYCPFKLEDEQPLYKRKYDIMDDDADAHELKVCEELYYHSAHNPRYIQELNQALREIGIQPKESRELPLQLKESFKTTDFYQHGFIYKNKRVAYDRTKVVRLDEAIVNTGYSYALKTGSTSDLVIFETSRTKAIEAKRKSYKLVSFGKHVIRKAMSSYPDYQFKNLKFLFPNLKSVDEFIESTDYLANVKVTISGAESVLASLPQVEKLNAAKKVLSEIALKLEQDRVDYEGTKEFTEEMVKSVFKDKVLNIVNDGDTKQEFGIGQNETTNDELRLDLSNRDWFAFNENYGTSEEKHLVRYIDEMMSDLQQKYDQVYLLRNEKHFKLYTFNGGRAFEPDFVLFLEKQKDDLKVGYQVFIEPKGDQLLETDAWKQEFLNQMKAKHKIKQVWPGKEFTVWGMPFYNHNSRRVSFEPAFEKLME